MRMVSLGDSFSCGEGVGLRLDLDRTWVGLVAAGLGGCEWSPLAVAGARVRDVRTHQLPAALALGPELATVLVGLNDVVRSGFVATDVAVDLTAVVAGLRAQGCQVLLGRLHDPATLLPLGPLGRAVAERVAGVCRTVDVLAADPGVHVVDLGAVARLRERECWAVDRVHPSAAGHRAMAVAAAAALGRAGLTVHLPPTTGPDPAPSMLAQARWLVGHGLPWTAWHLRSVALPLVAMAAGVSPRPAPCGRAPGRRATGPSPRDPRRPGTAYG